jgi:uncharacterized phage protein (TIGR01671 family)
MKDIKFRMWNNVRLNPKKSKYFYDADMVMDCLKQQMIFDQNPDNKLGYNHIGDGNSFEEFTGLPDKNKKDIFEGDIIEYRNELGKHSVHKVFRVEGGLVINSHSDDFYKEYTPFYEACADMQTSGWIQQCEVIGNIHENPIGINRNSIEKFNETDHHF